MALVRCPTHKIPYNDENPRGCPACAREEGGKRRVSVMQELAKAQRASTATEKPTQEPRKSASTIPVGRRGTPPTHPAYRRKTAPSVAAWRPAPVPEEPTSLWARYDLKERFRPIAIVIVAILGIVWIFTAGPHFRPGMFPVAVEQTPRPLPLDPNMSIVAAFGMLGTGAPKSNPDSPRLARYTYGSDLMVDASNGVIYALTIRVPTRSWRGLHTGMPEQTARGALALLGAIEEPVEVRIPQPEEVGGYWVYPSLDGRPRRTLAVQIRPPNGCYAVQVDLRPQAIGTLDDGERRYAVVGSDDATLNWVVTQVRVVSRSLRGPYSGVPAC